MNESDHMPGQPPSPERLTGPQPGVMHPVDEAFYKLAIKERDYERRRVERLESDLAAKAASADRLAEASTEFLKWYDSRYPKGQSKNLPGVALYSIAESFREALNSYRGTE